LRPKLSCIMLTVLFLALLAVQPINQGVGSTIPKVFVDPTETKDSAKGPGTTFTVNVNVSNVEELYGWQINMTFNPEVVNTTTASIVEGPFLKQAGTTIPAGKIVDNLGGYLLVGYLLSLFPTPPPGGASGNGTLVRITFTVRAAERATLLQFVRGTKLNSVVGGNQVPISHTTEDGIFDNRVVNAQPIASFSVDLPVANVSDAIRFNASDSYDPDAWLVSYHWDYGDGTTEIYMREPLRNVNLTAKTTHIYTRAGTYTVTLTVTDNDGATSTATDSVSINGHDVAVTMVKASHIAVMQGTQVTVDVTVANLGTYSETFNVTAYYNETRLGLQELTDMLPQTETPLTFTWNTTGVDLGKYVVKANATIVGEEYDTDNNEYVDGLVTVALTNIIHYPVVVGGFTFYVVAESTSTTSNFQFNGAERKIGFTVMGENETAGFSNVTIPIDLLGGPYTVLFDDSPIIPEPQEATNGTHTFLHFIYNHSSHMVEIMGQRVATPPVAVFTASTTRPIAHVPVTFDATDSEDPDGTIESYHWDFGDDNVTLVDYPIIEHAYTATGNHTVTLTVKDNKQLMNSTQTKIVVIDYPTVEFSYTPTAPLVDEEVTFNAAASEPNGGSITSFQWDFGDGTVGNGVTVVHAYSEVGSFVVVLNVTDSEDLWDTKSKTVTVLIHNIAVTEIIAAPNIVKIGQQVTIDITVANEGNFTETFNVTAYFDSQIIQTNSVVNMASGTSQTINMVWNTTGINPATYTIKATAPPVAEEDKTNDNTLIGNTVTIERLEPSAPPTALYIVGAVILIAMIAAALYFFKIKKSSK